MTIKQTLIFISSIIVGALTFFAFQITKTQVVEQQAVFIPKKVIYIPQPPEGAIQGHIITVSGKVTIEPRLTDDFQALAEPATFVQGESLATVDGTSMVVFNNFFQTQLAANTQIDYVNGLQGGFVLRQPKGKVTYTTQSTSPLLSVRSLALLTQFNPGAKATIETDPDEDTVVVTMLAGTGKVAFSDANSDTQVTAITQDDKVIFDNDKSTIVFR